MYDANFYAHLELEERAQEAHEFDDPTDRGQEQREQKEEREVEYAESYSLTEY